MDLLIMILKEIQPGRIVEGLIFLIVLWSKVRPHLEKIEDRMKGLENAIKTLQDGLGTSEIRFERIERKIEHNITRIDELFKKEGAL